MIVLGQPRDLPPSPCLNCGKMLDAASGVGQDSLPSPGDFTICFCGHVMAYAVDLTLRDLTDAEVVAIAGDKRLLLVQKALSKMKMKKEKIDRG